MKLVSDEDLYAGDTIEIQFDLDLSGEEARLTTLVAFCRTHRIYFSLATEYFDEDNHRSRKLMINKSLRLTDLKGNRTSIPIDPAILTELDELMTVLVSQSEQSDLGVFYRFRAVDMNSFIAQYTKITELLGDRFFLKYLVKHYDWANSIEVGIFEIDFKDPNDILKLKLTYSSLNKAFFTDYNQ